MRTLALPFLLVVAAIAVPAAEDTWAPLRFLEGNWIGDGGGVPGQGTGAFSFRFDLQGTVLVRRSHAQYPPTKDRPAYRHDDLMVIFQEAGLRAVFFDNEGHVIRYAVSPQGDGVEFLSEPATGAPRFRFTYTKQGRDAVLMRFEIAPPGQPETFKTYVEGRARRTQD